MRRGLRRVLGRCPRTGIVAAVLLALLLSRSSLATSIDPMIWQQLTMTSDFIGTVECVTGGECVARYTVIDAWKGSAPGAAFNMYVPVDMWGPIPITLPGQRFLLMVRAALRPLPEFPSADKDVRLTERARVCAYTAPLFQGRFTLPFDGQRLANALRSDARDLDQFKALVTGFLAKDPKEQERSLIVALARKHLSKDYGHTEAEVGPLLESLERQTSVDAVLTTILSSPLKTACGPLLRTILYGGQPETIRYFRENEPYGKAFLREGGNERALDMAVARSKRVLSDEPRSYASTISDTELEKLRQTFAAGPRAERFDMAFSVLCERDPDLVAPWLARWKNDLGDTSVARAFVLMRPYRLGNTFCQTCPTGRAGNLWKLLRAREPYVQAAAAVYLSYASPDYAKSELKRVAALDDDPGAWAAITLVAAGAKEQVPRALEVFKGAADMTTMAGMHHLDLQRRMTVLLSNTAVSSGAPLPQVPEMTYEKPNGDSAYAYLSDWWKENKDKVTLANPWLAKAE